MRLTAIDPGDRWVGLASLHSMPERGGIKYGLNIGVMDRSTRSLREAVDNALRSRPEHLIVEEFRARPQGHQRFSELKTPRLIGALEYASPGPVHFVPAGNADEDVPRLLGRDLMKMWKGGMDARGFGQDFTLWRHGWSAWRALALYILKNDVSLLERLRSAGRTEFRMSDLTFPTGWILDQPHDLSARTLIWRSE